MIAAIYARVSTDDQDCTSQLAELRRYIEARNWKLGAEYIDHAVSGKKASRPELDRMMDAARRRLVDVVLVWKLDRLGRSVAHLSQALTEFDSLGIRFIATSQGIDTDRSNPTSRLLTHILAAVAEFERELISERTKAGVATARRKGRVLGRPIRIFDREMAEAMLATGASLRSVSRDLNVPEATVRLALKRRNSSPI